MDDFRVLSIQSHVVHGYCGNKCATFPLQLHGFEVDAINSVQFSNHTAYECWKGPVLSDDQIWEIYQGLKTNKINHYSHLLTGYARSEAILKRIVDIAKDLKIENEQLIYICDPVMGDSDDYYVPESLMPIYRDFIIPLADVVTPNQFELQVLTGISIDSQASLTKAIGRLHHLGPKIVVVTSTTLSPDSCLLYGYGSQFIDNRSVMFRFEVPRFSAVFFGTGDLFASLLLIWLQKTNSLKMAVEKLLSCIQDVLKKTFEYAERKSIESCTFSDYVLWTLPVYPIMDSVARGIFVTAYLVIAIGSVMKAYKTTVPLALVVLGFNMFWNLGFLVYWSLIAGEAVACDVCPTSYPNPTGKMDAIHAIILIVVRFMELIMVGYFSAMTWKFFRIIRSGDRVTETNYCWWCFCCPEYESGNAPDAPPQPGNPGGYPPPPPYGGGAIPPYQQPPGQQAYGPPPGVGSYQQPPPPPPPPKSRRPH